MHTADGVLVRETCVLSPNAGEAPCGTAAKEAVDVITRLTPLMGPFPRQTLALVPVHAGAWPRIARNLPGEIRGSETVFRFAGSGDLTPEVLVRGIAEQWLLFKPGLIQRRDAWLVHALPTYLAVRYLSEVNPQAAQAVVARALRDAPMEGTARALAEGDPEPRDAATLMPAQRGMMVLRTLETAIDRERVDRALPEMMRRAAGRPPTTEMLESACEEIAGRKLAWFFDYFIAGTKIPAIEFRRVPSESAGVVAGEIVVKEFVSGGSLRVEMVVRTAAGVVEHSVATHGTVTPFTVNVPATATGITVDPDLRILRWTDAARRSQAQDAILATIPKYASEAERAAAYRRAIAADPDDASRRAQSLNKELGEMEAGNDRHDGALAAWDAAVNGHSIAPFETYFVRANALLCRGKSLAIWGRFAEAREDVRAGMGLPAAVLVQTADVNWKPPAKTLREELQEVLKRTAKPK